MHEVQVSGSSILIIGYGNISRRDDGVALHVVQRLRRQLGLPTEDAYTEEANTLADGVCTLFVHQLAPELAETVAEFDVVVFVDAHVESAGWEPVHWQAVPEVFQSSMSGHHLKPSTVMLLARELYGQAPQAFVLSVLGLDFDFGEELTPATSARADEATERLVDVIRSCGLWPAQAAPAGHGG